MPMESYGFHIGWVSEALAPSSNIYYFILNQSSFGWEQDPASGKVKGCQNTFAIIIRNAAGAPKVKFLS